MWEGIKKFFSDSETLFFARLQMLAGAVWQVLISTDLAPLMDPKFFTTWLVVSGVITEMARRLRSTDL